MDRLLYITPNMPTTTGNGLAMRAGAVLQALTRNFRVSLLVAPIYLSAAGDIPPELANQCERIEVLDIPDVVPEGVTPLPPPGPPPYEGEQFDVVHVFRLATLLYAQPYLNSARRRHLDLDDIESVAFRRLSTLYVQNGQPDVAEFAEAEAARAAHLEQEAMQTFDRVYVCSAPDVDRLPPGDAEIRVLPNAVALPSSVSRPTAEDWGTRTLLFVGTLSYFPNADAVRWFSQSILPALRKRPLFSAPWKRGGKSIDLAVVGVGSDPILDDLAGTPGLQIIGAVNDVTPYYRAADAVVVPIRAGGGTRIKILEAFAHKRPVVSTSLGMEGIEARDGEHLLVADEPKAFVDACKRVLSDPVLVSRLTEQGRRLVEQHYSLDAMARIVAVDGAPPPRPADP